MAGMSNVLSGVVAANSRFPTIAHPVFNNQMNLMNINQHYKCHQKYRMTVLSVGNVVGACQKIFNMM